MRFYFNLQFKRINRFIEGSGFHPVFGYSVIGSLFLILSYVFFQSMIHANYIYPALALFVMNLTAGRDRNNFLKNCFTKKGYASIRLIENALIATPFVVFLLYKNQLMPAISLYLVGSALSLFSQRNLFSFVIPTPFGKWPYEFTAGFRKTFWIFLICYILTYISIDVDNFNLGIFALIATFLTCLSYYSKPEPSFYVWVHSVSPSQFLQAKMKIAIFYSLCISAPIALAMIKFNPDMLRVVLLFEILGLLFVTASVLGKYAYYPTEPNLVQSFALAGCMIFPPALLGIIPFFYVRSKSNLNSILI